MAQGGHSDGHVLGGGLGACGVCDILLVRGRVAGSAVSAIAGGHGKHQGQRQQKAEKFFPDVVPSFNLQENKSIVF